MQAIEIRNLTKNFGEKQALKGLNMTVPVGSIYGFIGENGSGKSTTEKIICGLIHATGGSVKLFGREHTDRDVRAKVGVLIESPGCFPGCTVWNNLMLQAANLNIPNAEEEVVKVLKLVRMEGAAGNKYKNCSNRSTVWTRMVCVSCEKCLSNSRKTAARSWFPLISWGNLKRSLRITGS